MLSVPPPRLIAGRQMGEPSMIRIPLKWCFLVIASLLGCQRQDSPDLTKIRAAHGYSDSIAAAQRVDISDTVIQFRKGGKSYWMGVSKLHVSTFTPFQQFLDTFRIQALPIVFREETDVTGDGIPDSCVAQISLRQLCPFIEHSVYSRHRRIWYDSLIIDDESGGAMYWDENESLYVALRPFTGLFSALTFLHFVGDQIDTAAPSFGFLANQNRDMVRYLRGRKGAPLRSIEQMDLVDPADMVWDQRVRKFVVFAAP